MIVNKYSLAKLSFIGFKVTKILKKENDQIYIGPELKFKS